MSDDNNFGEIFSRNIEMDGIEKFLKKIAQSRHGSRVFKIFGEILYRAQYLDFCR